MAEENTSIHTSIKKPLSEPYFCPLLPLLQAISFEKILPKEKEEKRLNPILLTKRNIDKYCHHGYWPLIHVRIRNWNDAWTITPTVSEYASFREEKVSVVLGFFIRYYILKSTLKVIGDFSWFSQIPSVKRDDYQTHFMWKKTLGICWGAALLMANFNCA